MDLKKMFILMFFLVKLHYNVIAFSVQKKKLLFNKKILRTQFYREFYPLLEYPKIFQKTYKIGKI